MRAILVCFAVLFCAARADIAPTPDAGPFTLSVAGLDFAIQDVKVKYPPGYTKTFQVAVLTGCTEGHANCTLAKAKNLIGMEVESVNGESLRPEAGRLHQIAQAFKHGAVKLELDRRDGGEAVTVSFSRR
jgi:hypothetical protein